MYLLLDIDGVMVPEQSWKRPEVLQDGFPVFSAKALGALRKVLDQTGATIILTTSHKSSYSIAEWKDIFCLRGLAISDIDRLPANDRNLSRKDEILNWYNAGPYAHESFVIIDDDKSLNALPDFLKENVVMTSSMIGLTDELADKAISILEAGVLVPA